MTIPQSVQDNKRIILFDGVCNLCSGFMHFVYKRDAKKVFMFAWLQDQSASEIQQWLAYSSKEYDTIIYIEDGEAYYKSTAVLKIFAYLRFPWTLLRIGYLLPLPLRDRLYDFVATRRYRFFGKKQTCELPQGDLIGRFL